MFTAAKLVSALTLGAMVSRLNLKVGDVFYFANGKEKTLSELYKIVGIYGKYLYSTPLCEGDDAQPDVRCLLELANFEVVKFDINTVPVPTFRAIFRNKKGEAVLSQRLFLNEDEAKLAYTTGFLQLDNTPVMVSKKFLEKRSA